MVSITLTLNFIVSWFISPVGNTKVTTTGQTSNLFGANSTSNKTSTFPALANGINISEIKNH